MPKPDWGAFNIPGPRRNEVLGGVRSGKTRDEILEDWNRRQATIVPKTPPRRAGDTRIEVDASEYRNLVRIAEMVKRLHEPMERAGIPLQHLSEWEALHEAFAALEGADWLGPDLRIEQLREVLDQTK